MAFSVKLTPKQVEAVLWGIAVVGDRVERVPSAGDPLHELLAAGHRRETIALDCQSFENEMCDGDQTIAGPLTPLQRDIMRLSIEKSGWLDSYRAVGFSELMFEEAKAALRELAESLEPLGVEVSSIQS